MLGTCEPQSLHLKFETEARDECFPKSHLVSESFQTVSPFRTLLFPSITQSRLLIIQRPSFPNFLKI